MEKYRRVVKEKSPPSDSEIRIATSGKVGLYVSYGYKHLSSEGNSKVVIKATGNALTKAVTVCEILKRKIYDLHQLTELGSLEVEDEFEPLEEGLDRVLDKRQVSFVTITLSKVPLNLNEPGYQAPITVNEAEKEAANKADTAVGATSAKEALKKKSEKKADKKAADIAENAGKTIAAVAAPTGAKPATEPSADPKGKKPQRPISKAEPFRPPPRAEAVKGPAEKASRPIRRFEDSDSSGADLADFRRPFAAAATNDSQRPHNNFSRGRGGRGRFSPRGRGGYSSVGRGYSSGGRDSAVGDRLYSGNRDRFSPAARDDFGPAARGGFGGEGRGGYSSGNRGGYSSGGRGGFGSTARGGYSSGGRDRFSSGGRGGFGAAGRDSYVAGSRPESRPAGRGGFSSRGGFGTAGRDNDGPVSYGSYRATEGTGRFEDNQPSHSYRPENSHPRWGAAESGRGGSRGGYRRHND